MFRIISAIILIVNTSIFAVDGYEDIYIDREQDIVIHGVLCGENLNNLAALKPGYVFTNTESILKGTYYYNSPYGNYSFTFNVTENESAMIRGLLKEGQTKKEQMIKSICLVNDIEGLPNAARVNLKKKVLKANDPQWDQIMKNYTFVTGKPAYGKGVFKDNRTSQSHAKADEKIYEANQKYLAKFEKLFKSPFNQVTKDLPQKVKNAINFARKSDGKLTTKTYPKVKRPAVLTPTSKERYEDLKRQRQQKIAWDKVMQLNIDWLFNIVGRNNKLVNSKLITKSKPKWNGQSFEQVATIEARFKNGKSLELDFLISSNKVDSEVFDTMETIKKKAELVRNNPIASSKKPRETVKMPTAEEVKAYSSVEKEEVFFSLFRNKKPGDSYRYK